ncbi:rubrerythrin family protein [Prosthecochloris sp. GSB1]|uniref:VIT1/CCC1 transporter family protein n=1 Tax=Prosthecochloris sp. GSB1 TaxID=281093 RepID=UPI000B8CB210|nr:VIT1/CCC1 transporter family protein [Prosthecochloris sp. GSB1]ASQ90652.1 rubrerythrin family protein [Prosthecochloris sp. GSB1]
MKRQGYIDPETALVFQKNEITEHHIYRRLAERSTGVRNRRVLAQIADDELRHYTLWKSYTRQDVGPDRLKVAFFSAVCSLLGLTFGIKLMEKGEKAAYDVYRRLPPSFQDAEKIVQDEEEHEDALIAMLDEERLKYTGSVVLGLNDALVELMGVLVGLTFALQDSRFVALTGIITGFAAALSMAASEYLSTRAEQQSKNPFKAALYTGIAYITTVVLLVTPYLVLSSLYAALATAFLVSICIIGVFNFYVSVAQDLPFRSRFLEMAGLSLGVAVLSFLAGMVVRAVFGVG